MWAESWFLFCAHRLIMVYICTKFHENILNSIRVMERTQKVNERTDGRPYTCILVGYLHSKFSAQSTQ